MALDSGARLGPYETVAWLGAGGMGEVYEAVDTRLNRRVALKILPTALVAPVARVLPFVEAALGVAILVPATRPAALLLLATLLVTYGAAMAINLLRGREDIDCGCGGASHPLSWGLVARNAVLAGAAAIASRPTLERSMDWIDALTLVLGVLAFYALYLMADELLRQASRLARSGRGEQDSAT